MLDIDKFGELVDGLLKKHHIQMLISLPEGTLDVEIEDNMTLGPAIEFYILLRAFPAVYKHFKDKIDMEKEEEFIDALLAMVKGALMETEGEENDR